MNRRKFLFFAVTGIILIAVFLRAWGVTHIDNDYDEWICLETSQNYASYIQGLHLKHLVYYNTNHEHPIFVKLVYGVSLIGFPLKTVEYIDLLNFPPDDPVISQMQQRMRTVSAGFGVLAAALLALINPLAGLLLAVHSFAVQFTSIAYLEAVPAFTSLLSMWAYDRWLKAQELAGTKPPLQHSSPGFIPGQKAAGGGIWRTHRWLILSAVALGLSAASKYVFAVAGIGILLHHFYLTLKQRRRVPQQAGLMLAWGLLALVVFFFADPYLWVKTASRLQQSLAFSVDFSQGERVARFAYPFYQPLIWLLAPVSQQSHEAIPYLPGSFLIGLDLPIALLAAVGLPRLVRRRGPYAAWLLSALVFLSAVPDYALAVH